MDALALAMSDKAAASPPPRVSNRRRANEGATRPTARCSTTRRRRDATASWPPVLAARGFTTSIAETRARSRSHPRPGDPAPDEYGL